MAAAAVASCRTQRARPGLLPDRELPVAIFDSAPAPLQGESDSETERETRQRQRARARPCPRTPGSRRANCATRSPRLRPTAAPSAPRSPSARSGRGTRRRKAGVFRLLLAADRPPPRNMIQIEEARIRRSCDRLRAPPLCSYPRGRVKAPRRGLTPLRAEGGVRACVRACV